MAQRPIYDPLPTGQRKVVPGQEGAPPPPVPLAPQPGLAGVAQQERARRAALAQPPQAAPPFNPIRLFPGLDEQLGQVESREDLSPIVRLFVEALRRAR